MREKKGWRRQGLRCVVLCVATIVLVGMVGRGRGVVENDGTGEREAYCAEGSGPFIHYVRIGKAGSSSMVSWLLRNDGTAHLPSMYVKDSESVLTLEEEKAQLGKIVSQVASKNERLVRNGFLRVGRGDGRESSVSLWQYISLLARSIGLFTPPAQPLRTAASTIVVYQHAFYPNYSRHGYDQPSLFTMMRDPVRRYLSQYNYWRTLGGEFGTRVRGPEGRSLDDCVQQSDSDTVFSCPTPNYMTAYLCGNGPPCKLPPDRASLDLAKHNLMHHFDVVGILENITLTTRVLSAVYPALADKRPITQNDKRSNPTVRSGAGGFTISKPTESQLRRIKSLNSYDITLYKLARKKLQQQAKKCGVLGSALDQLSWSTII